MPVKKKKVGSKTCSRVKGHKKGTKRVKTYARKKSTGRKKR